MSPYPTAVTFRDASSGDADSIALLIKQLAAASSETSPVTREYVEDFLAAPGNRVLLAQTGGGVVGMPSYSVRKDLYHAADSCLIEELVVRDDARGRGVGSVLLSELMARMEAEGCSEISVTTLADNEGAIRFYRRHGLTDRAVFLEKHFAKPK